MFDENTVLKILKDYNSIAIPVSLLISVIISLSGVLPSVFVTGANIIFFGTVKGFLISLLGETIGAYVTFTVYRQGFKKRVEKITDKYKLISRIVNSKGSKAGLLIFEGRLIPFIPSGVVTFAASVSNVGAATFSLATLAGKIPSIALEALVSYDIINFQRNWIRLIITVLSIVLIMLTIRNRE